MVQPGLFGGSVVVAEPEPQPIQMNLIAAAAERAAIASGRNVHQERIEIVHEKPKP